MISFRPRERAPRIGLVGWFGSGNIGNDGTLEALLGHLRTAYPQAAVDVLTNAPDVVTERYGLPATQLHWLHSPHPAGVPQRSLARRAVRVAHGREPSERRTQRCARRVARCSPPHDA